MKISVTKLKQCNQSFYCKFIWKNNNIVGTIHNAAHSISHYFFILNKNRTLYQARGLTFSVCKIILTEDSSVLTIFSLILYIWLCLTSLINSGIAYWLLSSLAFLISYAICFCSSALSSGPLGSSLTTRQLIEEVVFQAVIC